MSASIREQIEGREREFLSRYASLASSSLGRARVEDSDPVRTCFQRDRDRILHSKSFRRLKHKTQVFIDPVGDHYRTRLTHTLEVSQIARTIGRALRLNEDLIEAIALGHDVGHSPFGHAGESALDEAIRASSIPESGHGFRHDEQSLRVVDVLEHLNLSQETRDGIGGHSKGDRNLSDADGEPTSSLEAAVVRISDRVAYVNHDLDDAIRSGLVDSPPIWIESLGTTNRRRIGAMVEDIILHSVDCPAIRMSTSLMELLNPLKDWLFENVYRRYPVIYPDVAKAKALVAELFNHYLEPGNLPDNFQPNGQGAIDYVAGMTDRFAIETYKQIKVPHSWSRGAHGK